MAENLIDLRKRITSVKNTQKITKAMKTVSAAKLRKSVSELNRIRPTQLHLEQMLAQLIRAGVAAKHRFLSGDDSGESELIILISSDKGLCGSFNTHLFRRFEEEYQSAVDRGKKVEVAALGLKGARYLRKSKRLDDRCIVGAIGQQNYAQVLDLSSQLQKRFLDTPISAIKLVSTFFDTSSRQHVDSLTLFPLILNTPENVEKLDYLFEPSPDLIFNRLLPLYINTRFYRVLMESLASEHVARMVAMDTATRNASDMIRRLTLTMNKLRQASITNEILEIITATEALKS